MKIKEIVCVMISIVLMGTVSAQDVREALNLSNTAVQGTARSMGYGNALGSVGGDFSSFSVNPAGIGVYRSSEMSITPGMNLSYSKSQYTGVNTNDNNIALNVSQWGMVFTNAAKGKRYERRNWKSVSFGFGMNRVADFNVNYSYEGKSNTSSASQAFESDANLHSGNDSMLGTLGYLGYQSYLLNDSAGKFYTTVPFKGGIDQTKTAQVRGTINEFVLTLGGNYKEKLLLGATIGLPSVNYQYNSVYTESVSSDNISNPYNFSSFSYGKSLSITGSGVNLKLGAIYMLNDNIRIGASFHSPTFYNLHDEFTPFITTNINGTTNSIDASIVPINNSFDYTFITPWKGILSGTYIIKKLGFVTVDYEYVDYASMQYVYPSGYDGPSQMSFQTEEIAMNQQIRNTYKPASNLRVGAEIKLGSMFMVRAGVGYYGNAYKNSDTTSQRMDVSAGLGFRFKKFFTDLGFVHSMYENKELPYRIDYSGVYSGSQATIPQAKTAYQLNNLAWTIGYKFR